MASTNPMRVRNSIPHVTLTHAGLVMYFRSDAPRHYYLTPEDGEAFRQDVAELGGRYGCSSTIEHCQEKGVDRSLLRDHFGL